MHECRFLRGSFYKLQLAIGNKDFELVSLCKESFSKWIVSNYGSKTFMALLLPSFFQTGVILLPVHPVSFAHNFVHGMQRFQQVPVCNSIADLTLKIVFWTLKFAIGLIDMGYSESQDPLAQNCK